MQLLFTQLLRKISVIGRVKSREIGRGRGVGGFRSGTLSLDLLPDFFFASNFFPPELEVSEEKILKCNSARKKREDRVRVDHPTPTSNRLMNELSSSQS
jgi:hypothetical protein